MRVARRLRGADALPHESIGALSSRVRGGSAMIFSLKKARVPENDYYGAIEIKTLQRTATAMTVISGVIAAVAVVSSNLTTMYR
jgi:hypothetical protein